MPRLDRLITLYVCAPVARLTSGDEANSVPILAYHSISENLFGYSHPYYQINTSPSVFAAQMRWLRSSGYCSMGLAEAWTHLAAGRKLTKTVVVTFDDGYRDFYTEAMDVLKQCGFTATVFLATGRIRQKSARIEGADYLTWQEVRELHAEGIQFGSHTVTHPDLRSMDPDLLDYELGQSKEVIEQNLGVAVESFSYPFSFPEEDRDFTRFLEDLLQNLGFTHGVSTILGRACKKDNRYFLPRLPMNSWDDARLLQAKVRGGYDWLHWPQLLKKSLFHNTTLMQQGARNTKRAF
jgi:peptidoglycan/xylan/chitin deacetylase (PgdA/CDA1 family)